MTNHQDASLLGSFRRWTNDGSPIPDWVKEHMAGKVLPNGTFIIATPVGSARVHVGNMVIEHRNQLWSRSPDDIPELIAGLKSEAPLNVTAIGPGKSAQFGTKSRAGKNRYGPKAGLTPS